MQLHAGPSEQCIGDATFGTMLREFEDAFARHESRRPAVDWCCRTLGRRARRVEFVPQI